MEHLELRHLRTLCAIADTGSLRRAASRQGYSQPAMTTQLQRIENLFGEPLFERSSTGVVPTPFGVEVVAQARDVLARVGAMGRRAPRPTAIPDTALRLAATNTPILSGLVTRIRSTLPELGLTVSSVYSSAEIVDLLENDGLDVAVGVDYPGRELSHSAAITHRGIVTEPCFVAMSTGHRLAHQVEVSLTEMADDAWFLTPDDGAGWPGVFYTACEVAGFRPAAVHEFLGDRRQLHSMIAEGLGVAVVQATFEPTAGVTVKSLVGTPLWCRYLLAWRPAGVSEDVADAIHRHAAAAYRDLIAFAPHFQSWAARTFSATGN